MHKHNVTFVVLFACAMILALPQTRLARGQDDWNAKEPEPMDQNIHNMGLLVEQNINHWIFSCSSAAQGRRNLESKLTLRLNAIENAGGLTKPQVEKLYLAGRGDIETFFRNVDRVKKECEGLNINNQEFQKIWQKVQPLQQEYKNGVFKEGSLYHKVLQGIIRSDPSGEYQKRELERRKFHHKSMIEMAVAAMELGVPLTDNQRQKFINVLVAETKPPKNYGDQLQYVVFCLASKIDEKKLQPIFDKEQWRAVRGMLRQGKAMERHFRKQGLVF